MDNVQILQMADQYRTMQEQKKEDYDIVMYQLSKHRTDDCRYTKEEAIKKFLEHTTFRGSLCDKLIKRDLFEGLRIDETVSYGEDALLVWQVLQRIDKMLFIGKAFYHYRVNKNSLSRQRFNGKKFTAYTTWNQICEDTDTLWPRYRDIAHARFACEMTQILLDASRCGYKYDKGVELLQEEVARDAHLIVKTGISSGKMRMFAWLVSHSYWLARLLSPHI